MNKILLNNNENEVLLISNEDIKIMNNNIKNMTMNEMIFNNFNIPNTNKYITFKTIADFLNFLNKMDEILLNEINDEINNSFL